MFEDVRYKRNRLSQVVVKVDFLVPIAGLGGGVPPKLANRLAQRFPIVEPGLRSVNLRFELNREGSAKSSQEEGGQFFNFFGSEREKNLTFTDRFLTIVHTKYDTYEKFSEDFLDAYKVVQEFFPDVMTSRFGLRYINIFDPDERAMPLRWEVFFNQDLVANSHFFRRELYQGQLTRLFNVAELKYDEISMRFQYGEPNPDFPAVMKKAQFVLDMDAYTQGAHKPEETFRYMDAAHMRIQQVFEDSITEELREWMNA